MNIEKKTFDIEDLKIEIKKEDGKEKIYISGYANTKNKPDAYGDIPIGDNVYDLKRFKANPVLLVDHNNSAGMIAGRFVMTKEDEKGLAFKARLMDLEDIHNDIVKHAVSAFIKGFGRALSIGGRWLYDKKHPKHLTKAIIHEISLVGVGADGNALTDVPPPKKISYKQATKDNMLDEAKKINKKLLKKIIKEIDHE